MLDGRRILVNNVMIGHVANQAKVMTKKMRKTARVTKFDSSCGCVFWLGCTDHVVVCVGFGAGIVWLCGLSRNARICGSVFGLGCTDHVVVCLVLDVRIMW